MPRGPIIFDFETGRAYRANEHPKPTKDLAEAMRQAASKRRVVKRVEGIPPQAIRQHKT